MHFPKDLVGIRGRRTGGQKTRRESEPKQPKQASLKGKNPQNRRNALAQLAFLLFELFCCRCRATEFANEPFAAPVGVMVVLMRSSSSHNDTSSDEGKRMRNRTRRHLMSVHHGSSRCGHSTSFCKSVVESLLKLEAQLRGTIANGTIR